MSDIASLGIAIDSTQVKEGKSALDAFVVSGGKAEDAAKKLEKAAKQAGDSQATLANATKRSAGAADDVTNSSKKAEDATRRLEQAAKDASKASNAAADAEAERAKRANALFDRLGYGKTQTDSLSKANETLANASQEASAAQTSLGGAVGVVSSAIKLAIVAFAGMRLIDYARDAALLQARYETMSIVMRVVGNNAGYTGVQMEEAARKVQDMGITMLESRQQVTKLVQSEIDLSNATKLARIAQDAAVIGNTNSSEAFQRLIHGIQSGQSETLRLMGINVTAQRAYKTLADQMGVNVTQLTQNQRMQAVLNAVLKEGEKIAGTYEAAMGTAGKQMLSVQRYGENLKTTVGEIFNDALVIGVEAVTVEMKNLNKEARDLAEKNQLQAWGRNAIMIAANVIDAFRLIKNTFVQAGNGIMFLVQATKLAVTGQFEELKKLSAQQEKENQEFVKGITLVSDLAQARFALIDAEKAHEAALQNTTKSVKKHTDETLVDVAALKKAEEEYKKLIQSIREKIAVQELELSTTKPLTDSQKFAVDVMVKLRDGELKLTTAKKQKLVALLEEYSAVEQNVAAMQFAKKASEDLVAVGTKEVASLKEQIEAQQLHNATIGMTNAEVVQFTGSKNLEYAANVRNAAQYAGPLHDAYITYANDLVKVTQLQKQLVAEKQIQQNAEEWARIGNTIEQTGKMAFIQFAAHGISAMKSIGDAIKFSIYDMLYQLTIRKWTISIGTSFLDSIASGMGSALGAPSLSGVVSGVSNSFSLMNIASGIKSVFSAFTGGASSLVSAVGTSGLGISLGLGTAGGSVFGAGVGAGAGAGTAFIGGAGTALGGTGATAAGLSGMGGMLAAAAGPVAIAAAVDTVFRLLAGNKTIKGAEALTYVPVIGPIINALFGMGPKKLGPAELTGNFSDTGFSGQFEADWTRKAGFFAFGKKKGRRGLGITAEQDAALDASVVDLSRTYKDLIKVTGDSDRSLQGWTFSVKQTIDTEEQQEKLTNDLSNSIGERLIPELTLIQQKGEELADTAARAASEFSLVNSILDIMGKTLNQAGLASLTMRDDLIQLLGGVDNASSMLQPFFDTFYTAAERTASTTRLLTGEFAKLGVTLPATNEQYRALVEAQDLNTSAGREMFASLIQLAPAFSSITGAAKQAADEAAATAKQLADSIRLLTTDSFSTLFEYTRYLRLAANAGVSAAKPQSPVFENPAPVFQLPSFDVGTNSLPSDMVAKVHKGERIVPAADNRALMQALNAPNENNKLVINELKKLREEMLASMLSLIRNTGRTSKVVEDWDNRGMPEERLA